MGIGLGFGLAFGGRELLPLADPRSEVGADPVTIDFTDEPDGPLPGRWECYAYTWSGGVLVNGDPEAAPDDFYRVTGGRGFFRYKRTPVSGAPFSEQGVAASPQGILQGRNAELAVSFTSPTLLVNKRQDELYVEVIAALRAADDGSSWVGARARAGWAAGVWTTPVALEAVRATTGAIAVLASADVPDIRRPEDIWTTQGFAEVTAKVVGTRLTASLNGRVMSVETTVPAGGASRPLVIARVYMRRGVVTTPLAVLGGVRLRSLRDLERLGAPPQLPGDGAFAPPYPHRVTLPLVELTDQGFTRRLSAREWEFVADAVTDVLGMRYGWQAGDRVLAAEPFYGQALVPCTVNLAATRAARGGR